MAGKCAVCQKPESDKTAGTQWTMCVKCKKWYHNLCASIEKPIPEDIDWTCITCVEADQTKALAKTLERLEEAKKREKELEARIAKQKELLAAKKEVEAKEKRLKQLEKAEREARKDAEREDQRDSDDASSSSESESKKSKEGPLVGMLQQQLKLVNRQHLGPLPIFSGNPADWPFFLAQFESSTEQGNFSDAENMARLRASLKGSALETVKAALCVPNNSKAVIETLRTCFGRSDVLIRTKMKELTSLATPYDSKPATVKSFYEFLSGLRSTLNNVKAHAYLTSPQLIDTIEERLPPECYRSWIRHKAVAGEVDLNAFLAWYFPYYQVALMQSIEKATTQNSTSNQTSSQSNSAKRVNAQEEKRDDQCSFCRKSGHVLSKCKKFEEKPLSIRWSFVKKGRWCFSCLLQKHKGETCDRKKKCDVTNCTEPHHPFLHKHNVNDDKKSETVASNVDGDSETFFRLVPVRLWNGSRCYTTWAFLDEGSGPTLVSEKVARQLKLSGEESELCLKWANGHQVRNPTKTVRFQISGVSENKKFTLENVKTVPDLDLPYPSIDMALLREKYSHLKDVDIPDIPPTKPEILIGLEHVKLMIASEVREGDWKEPIAARTKIGWSIYGKTAGLDVQKVNVSCHVCECSYKMEELDSVIKSFFTTESFGTTIATKKLESIDDQKAMEIFDKTVKYRDGRYEVGLLWKNPDVTLPNNRPMAEKRLQCFEQKLKRDSELAKGVQEKFKDMLEKGYLEEVQEEELQKHRGKIWFLPVFAVTNPNKPGKIRLVYDAAAKYEGISLNDLLVKGPDNLTPLLGILLRFRRGRIGICGDIAEWYHQILIIEDDQYVQLILWRDLDDSSPPKIYKLVVMSFGAKCSPSTANHIKNIHAKRYEKTHKRAVTAVCDSHYVDDVADSESTVDAVIHLAETIRMIHAEAGFIIRNWISNSKEVVAALNKDKAGVGDMNLNFGEDGVAEKVLGMFWATDIDAFVFKLSFKKIHPDIINNNKVPTKREVLRVIMSPFDPFGILAPVILSAKVLMQGIWRSGCQWDEEISEELDCAWRNWLKALPPLKTIQVPRWISPLMECKKVVQLHTFADSSEWAFAAVTYLKIISEDKRVTVSFIAAKTRVAPSKPLTIPRLELQAAVLATRLSKTITEELKMKIDRKFYWSDSQTVLGWLRSDHRRYSSFVASRVGEILQNTTINEWRWVPSKENVADEATKWQDLPKISERWLAGPHFLLKEEEEWPVEKSKVNSTEEEIRSIQYHLAIREEKMKYDLIDCQRFSNWNRLLRATGFFLRCVDKIKRRVEAFRAAKLQNSADWVLATKQKKNPPKVLSEKKKQRIAYRKKILLLIAKIPELNGAELEAAEKFLLQKTQIESFGEEVKLLSSNKQIAKSSKIYNLSPIMTDGLLRVETRLDSAPPIIQDEIRRPIILDGNHKITRLIIGWFHRKFHHCAKETVTNELRCRFWIPKIRIFVSKTIKDCTLCACLKAKPQIPRMASLPASRLQPFSPPFSHTGLDLMGPFEVVVGRRHEKRYVVIFTCMVMRAVHLEVVSSMNTSSAIMAVRNFINRRGAPVKIVSDNGANLRAAEKELREAWEQLNQNQLMEEGQSLEPGAHKIEWVFNPPYASHFGGIWERMVRTVKQGLYFALKSSAPKDETFRSIVIEVEGTVNSRPLNYMSGKEILLPAITPNSFLHMSQRGTINPLHEHVDSRKQWAIAQEHANKFWGRWIHEYLPTISTRSKWYSESKPIEKGQLVFIVDDNLKRGDWKRGVIENVIKSPDGRIRSAVVRTEKKSYLRPVAKLAIINIEKADN